MKWKRGGPMGSQALRLKGAKNLKFAQLSNISVFHKLCVAREFYFSSKNISYGDYNKHNVGTRR
jgi:hypothetical protein